MSAFVPQATESQCIQLLACLYHAFNKDDTKKELESLCVTATFVQMQLERMERHQAQLTVLGLPDRPTSKSSTPYLATSETHSEVTPNSSLISTTASSTFTSIIFKSPILVTDFRILAFLGQGASGKVLKVQHKESGTVSALKTTRKLALSDRHIEALAEERAALETVRGLEGIIQVQEAFEDSHNFYLLSVRGRVIMSS